VSDARQRLERRLDELSREVRSYPTPIARCDEQLGALLEERAYVLAELRRLGAPARGGCPPLATWANDGGRHAP
jgi:hypothetical protein